MDTNYAILFDELDKRLENGRVIISIEGGSASGKTTLSQILDEKYDCTVFHMDDFFLQPYQRTKERFNEIGGNIDWERFLDEVLIPLRNYSKICYRKFDCSTMSLGGKIEVNPNKLIVVEGVYSLHPKLEEFYDLSIFLDISPEDAFIRKGGADKDDRLEQSGLEFHKKVYLGYKQLAKDNPHRIAELDAKKGAEEVFEDIIQILKERQIIG